jgi:hypothetical protein
MHESFSDISMDIKIVYSPLLDTSAVAAKEEAAASRASKTRAGIPQKIIIWLMIIPRAYRIRPPYR